jgi:WD40 repeat protein
VECRDVSGKILSVQDTDEEIACFALDNDGRQLVVALASGKWKVFGVEDGKLRHVCDELLHPPAKHDTGGETGRPLVMSFSPGGTFFAIGAERWCTTSIYRADTWDTVQPPCMHGHAIFDMAFAPQETLWVFDYSGDISHYQQPPYQTPHAMRVMQVTAPILDGAISPDGNLLAAAMDDWQLKVWETRPKARLSHTLQHQGPVTSASWSADGRFLVTGCRIHGSDTGEIAIWHALSGRCLWRQSQPSAVVQVSFVAEDNRILTAMASGSVSLQEIASMRGD